MNHATARGMDEVPVDDLPRLADEFRQLAGISDCGDRLRDQLLHAATCIDAFAQLMQTDEFVCRRQAMADAIKVLMPIVAVEYDRITMLGASRHIPTTDTVQ